jgi:8-oxo-dGTP diphosphatase
MKHREISVIVFHDNKGNILIQDRHKHSKYGEKYGFFGGGIEKGETPKQAIIREIREELNYPLKDLKFFKKYHKELKEFNKSANLYVFLASLPGINEVNAKEGKTFFTNMLKFKELQTMPWDNDIIKDITEYINNLQQTK